MQRPVHQISSNHGVFCDERFCCLVALGLEDQKTAPTWLVVIIHKKTASHGTPCEPLRFNPTAMVLAMPATLIGR